MSSDKNINVSFNKTKTLSGDELFNSVLRRQFFTIMTNATGVAVGFILSHTIKGLIENIIPKNENYNNNVLITMFLTLILFLILASLIFTINYIDSKKSESLVHQ